MDLAEYAIAAIEESVEMVDSSNGGVYEILGELVQIHRKAALSGATEVNDLAKRLFKLEMTTSWVEIDHQDYMATLGDAGLAQFRQEVENAWNEALNPISSSAPQGTDDRLERLMLSFAQSSGDLEQSIRILTRDLSRPDRYLSVAEAYAKAEQTENAISWAERGVKAFPNQCHGHLNAFLITQYRIAGRHDEALAILWNELENLPSLSTYQALQKYASAIDRWGEWRDKAWAFLRKPTAASRSRGWPSRMSEDRSLVVQILLWEGKDEEAWQEAQAGGCTNDLWLELAARREPDHPEDTLAIYRQRVEPLIEQTTGHYDEPVEYLVKVKSLMDRLDRASDFQHYLTLLRGTYKRKRNFTKLLDKTFP
jgi:uncharacterized Zn finger protein